MDGKVSKRCADIFKFLDRKFLPSFLPFFFSYENPFYHVIRDIFISMRLKIVKVVIFQKFRYFRVSIYVKIYEENNKRCIE